MDNDSKNSKPSSAPQENYLEEKSQAHGRSQNALASGSPFKPIENALAKAPFNTASEVELLRAEVSNARKEWSKLRAEFSDLQQDLKIALNSQQTLQEKLSKGDADLSSRLSYFVTSTEERKQLLLTEFSDGLEAAQAAFSEQQAIRRPVELWKDKQAEHEKARDESFKWFQKGIVALALLVGVFVFSIITFASEIELLLVPFGCDPSVEGANCSGVSLKGMLLVALVLILFTILLWFVRLQMKLFLAERHLALDARERLAFVQSYIGLIREGDVSEEAKEQRALVYAALFRPASDGTVKEEGGLDPSVAAALSKFLITK